MQVSARCRETCEHHSLSPSEDEPTGGNFWRFVMIFRRQVAVGASRGIQHAKTLLVRSHGQASLSSSNWTTSSRANIEMGLLVEGSESEEVFQSYIVAFDSLWSEAMLFEAGKEAEPEPRLRRLCLTSLGLGL